jgi:putative membrane protein
VASFGGLLTPITGLFNWVITVILFGLAAWLIKGFRLKNGVLSAVLGAVVYAVISTVLLRILGLDVDMTRASVLMSGPPLA